MRLLTTALLSLAFTFSAAVALAQGRPAGVLTELVTVEQMSETTTVFGQVVAERESSVASRVSGVATEVPILVGLQVRKGDVLAAMDTELLRIEMDRAESDLALAEASLNVARVREESASRSYARANRLRETSAIADAQYEDRATGYAEARGAVQEALARVAAARNAIDRADYNLTNAVVRAPFDGIVLEVSTEVGQFVDRGSQVAVLLDSSAMEVQANVPSRLIAGLRPGLSVKAVTDAGAEIPLMLRAVLPTEFSATRTRPVLFEVAGGDGIAVGQSVTLSVPVGAPREVVTVPKDALVQARGGWSAFVNEAGKAVPRTVTIGASLGSNFEVLTGLQPGDEVVVRGNERLRPGQDIAPAGPPRGAGEAAGPVQPGEQTPAKLGATPAPPAAEEKARSTLVPASARERG